MRGQGDELHLLLLDVMLKHIDDIEWYPIIEKNLVLIWVLRKARVIHVEAIAAHGSFGQIDLEYHRCAVGILVLESEFSRCFVVEGRAVVALQVDPVEPDSVEVVELSVTEREATPDDELLEEIYLELLDSVSVGDIESSGEHGAKASKIRNASAVRASGTPIELPVQECLQRVQIKNGFDCFTMWIFEVIITQRAILVVGEVHHSESCFPCLALRCNVLNRFLYRRVILSLQGLLFDQPADVAGDAFGHSPFHEFTLLIFGHDDLLSDDGIFEL